MTPQHPNIRWLKILALLALLAAAALTVDAEERVFTVRGVVRGAFEDGAILIQHDQIPGFMPAMTMPFFTDAAEVEGLKPGDTVVFEFRVGERSRAIRFRRVAEQTATEVSVVPRAGPGMRVREGDRLPAFALIDQDERPLRREDLTGSPCVVTFVFTRCPVPEFCPLIGSKFQALQQELGARGSSARLLSISIDPEHDRPAVLREYAASLGADPDRWRFATGDAAEVDRLTQAFAVRTERRSGAIDHTLATALIDATGRVVRIWRGNHWEPAEVLAEIE